MLQLVNNNSDVSISIAQWKLSSVALTVVHLSTCIMYYCSLHANDNTIDMCVMCLVSLLSEGFIYKCKDLFTCWAECCYKTALYSKYCVRFIGAIYLTFSFSTCVCMTFYNSVNELQFCRMYRYLTAGAAVAYASLSCKLFNCLFSYEIYWTSGGCCYVHGHMQVDVQFLAVLMCSRCYFTTCIVHNRLSVNIIIVW